MRPLLLATILILAFSNPLRAAPDFETQVIPVLTRAGCNSGACHGAAIGRGGLRLSLLGYDPETDYESLLHEFKGRRIHLAQPEKSLLLKKPTRQLTHEGGHRLATGGAGYNRLLDWIKAGAPRGPGRSLRSLDITPTSQTLPKVGDQFTITVTARFSDGSKEDVTPWAVFTPTDSAALKLRGGEVTAMRRGQSAVMVRFLGEVGCVSVTVPLSDAPLSEVTRARSNFIDDHVNRTLDQLGLPHSQRADERTLVRRLYLDLIGTLPEPKEVEDYVADQTADKWPKLVDRLLSRPEFADHWAYKWADVLRIDSRRLGPGAAVYHAWLKEQVARNTPLDKLARELLLTLGDSHSVGPANFNRVAGDPGSHAELVSQVFLGVRLQCANCHNHPLDRWTQDDYHGLAAVFARLQRGRDVQLRDRGEVIHPRTGKAALPRLPGGEVLKDGDPREAVATWLTGPDNPYFARAAVNRLWRELLGRGLVEPVDDHRSTNPATHPDLLQALARDLAEHRYDLRHTLRTIVASEAYRRSSLSTGVNRVDDRFYSRTLVRPLPATVLVDGVARVTGVPEQLGDLPLGERALRLVDARVPSVPLDLLGRCGRDGSCVSASGASSLPLALHRINGPWLNTKIADPKGRLHQQIAAGESEAEIVAALYQSALGRKPSALESEHWQKKLATTDAKERTRRLEDFFWALLNSTEFTCNH